MFGPIGADAAQAPSAPARPWTHAGQLRGIDIVQTAGREREARFGVMFKKAASFGPPDGLLRDLAAQMGEPSGATLDNPDILAGDTFLGQFIDHDMTFDTTPMPEQQADPKGLTNFDTPYFDLASVYGRGPTIDSAFYESDRTHLRVVRNAEGVDDLPRRTDGTAYIGDPRNDENLILAQLHLLFVKFHNRCLDTGLAGTLAEAQRLTRWHFQWVIVHDFLPSIVGADMIARLLIGTPLRVKTEFYKPVNVLKPMMPIEYSVAAYRFGHSMVRAGYALNAGGGARMFDPVEPDLRGSRPLPATAEIEWWRFFDVPGAPADPRNPARLIDAKLAIPLLNLPPTVVSDPMVSLAERNLIRGKRLGLPAGQDVARTMGQVPLTNAELGLPDAGNPGWGGKAPLWFYILREAEIRTGGRRLGPVGGRLIAEVILGILSCDRGSFLNARTAWRPSAPIAPASRFTMGELVNFAQG
ncbi:heme peroxidase family protein [Actinoplanes sp. NPDC051633]|uniref:peroxidase family protein n=1 Tax=Actinoplanes sp. NPDC051633 TaxID=3155670 RepID=UPI00343D0B26